MASFSTCCIRPPCCHRRRKRPSASRSNDGADLREVHVAKRTLQGGDASLARRGEGEGKLEAEVEVEAVGLAFMKSILILKDDGNNVFVQ